MIEDILKHHGVKGMKWGVRRDKPTSSESKLSRVERKDQKWADKIKTTKNYYKVWGEMTKEINGGLMDKLNSNPKYSKDKLEYNPPLIKEYYREYSKIATASLNKHADRLLGTSKSGNLKVRFEYDAPNDILPKWEVVSTDIKHNVDSKILATINPNYDEYGRILSVSISPTKEDTMRHHISIGEDILQHHGVKGMKWGIRRDNKKSGGADGKADKSEKKPGRVSKELASLARERSWRKMAKNIDKMSTAEIQTMAKRIQQENEFKKLKTSSADPRSPIKNFKDAHANHKQYIRRADMSNQELTRRLNRMRATENLHKQVSGASKQQREVGMELVKLAAKKYVPVDTE